MLGTLGISSLDELMEATIPEGIRLRSSIDIPEARGERQLIDALHQLAERNRVFRSFQGMGYHDCITPPIIQRNILENPGWYTQYTPYQSEIAQGRLEALLNFQTMVADLTGLPLANASLLDESTAAAEAMGMCLAIHGAEGTKQKVFFVSEDCHPQTIAVLETRAQPLGIRIQVGSPGAADFTDADLFGVLLQYPGTDGVVRDPSDADRARARGRRHGGGGDGPAGTHSASPAGRMRSRHRGRLDATLRRAARFRRSSRGLLGNSRGARSARSGADRRRLAGRGRQTGLPLGAPDARAAHPARPRH